MKQQPVSDKEFWKDRLDHAKKHGYLHHSVYLANPVLWTRIFEAHKAIISNLVKKTDRVLDAGCGYGRFSELFENYKGVDISPDLLAEARKLYPHKEFLEGDMKKLPFKDLDFDIAICTSIRGMIIDNLGLEEWSLIEKELKRVAKKVLILEYGDTIEGVPENYLLL